MGADRDILAELQRIRIALDTICKTLKLNTQLVGWFAEQAYQEQQEQQPEQQQK